MMTRPVRSLFSCLLVAMLCAGAPSSNAQQRVQVSPADSALVHRILLAEQRRDGADPALVTGTRHGDSRIRTLAVRATHRIADSLFARRDSLPPLPAPTAWPEPDWKIRYRALTPRTADCNLLRASLADSAWPVRLRAADVVPLDCAADAALVSTLRSWIENAPGNAARRSAGGVSWHGAAHALVALARLRTPDALAQMNRAAAHTDWHMRLYAVRAARSLSDTSALRHAMRDRHPNVREAAIEGLAALTGHTYDNLFIAALNAEEPQVVRAAATALVGTTHAAAKETADAAFIRWVARGNASEHDARRALLTLSGRPTSEDRPPAAPTTLAPEAVALALGEDVRLRVTLSANSGGGSFVVRMRGDVAPIMAARILQLADSGYYNGGTWHRVEHDFVIQGAAHGDNEYVGNPKFLRDEVGNLPHARGTIGMSTRGHDTGDAQWFINLRENLRLGRDYTVFAEVVEGMSVVDGILEGDQIESISRDR
jgi:cyclophilin family peptidyl-prolyl cis-trans isomerase